MKSTQLKKWLALSLMLGLFGVLKAQNESIGKSGTCCPEKGATCWVLTWEGDPQEISGYYFKEGSGSCKTN